MATAVKPTLSKTNERFCQILGLNFFTGNASEAVDRMSHGGLLVVPSAPTLKDLRTNLKYREAALNADLLIADSSFMVLIWNWMDGQRIKRVSGLAYLRELLSRPDVRSPGATFWIMASPVSAHRNAEWLRSRGLPLMPDDAYVAPMYRGDIADSELLARLNERRPRHIIVTIGGGTQEGLGLYIKRNVDFFPAIHCIGAAIAFLSGDQVQIPEWADHFYLGWLLRCLADPRRYVARYWAARKLLPLMIRFRRELPSTEI
jgi:N-acetylglucosaminyldiphosphoundecaprenol N-acetyl-beta-D-mannosaminyltransferase